ncbi:MAG: MinD/ParA family protein [bacterium]|nr:MinD/ParA family protein [bacterium]
MKKSEIWAIGGGKGGTGKSFFTSSMGMSLAQNGYRVTLIDADLGGANLHSFLKIRKPKHSLTDFFEKKIPLSDIIITTDIPNLRFVTGDVRSLSTTGIKYTQKMKLYRHIKNISGDYVLIDLGAGSGHNTIDTFLMADKMAVVTLPEITAIENLYLFIKKVLFRKLNRLLGEHGLRDGAKQAWNERKNFQLKSIKELILHIREISPEIRTVVDEALADFKIYVVLNQVKNKEQYETGAAVKSVLTKYFGIDARFVGSIGYNEFFWKFVKRSNTDHQVISHSSTSSQMRSILRNLVEDKQIRLPEIDNG